MLESTLVCLLLGERPTPTQILTDADMMLPWTMPTGSWLRIAAPYRRGHLGSARFRKNQAGLPEREAEASEAELAAYGARAALRIGWAPWCPSRSTLSGSSAMNSNEQSNEGKPSSLRQPWWLDKAHRKDILLQFIVICVIVALLFLGTVIYLSQPV